MEKIQDGPVMRSEKPAPVSQKNQAYGGPVWDFAARSTHYPFERMCDNCLCAFVIMIPKGVRKEQAEWRYTCHNCGIDHSQPERA